MAKNFRAKRQGGAPVRSARAGGPPAARIVESFGAIGDLQLHGLDVPVSFTCATCRQRYRDDLVATVKGSWRLVVCHGCYLTLTRGQVEMKSRQGQRRKSKKQPGTRIPFGQARGAAPGAPVVPSQRAMSAEPVNRPPGDDVSANAPSRQGAQKMLHFFWAAGVVITRELTDPVPGFPQPETGAWRRAVDRFAWEHAYEVLARAVAGNARYGRDLEAVPLPREHGFAIMRGREEIAVIHPTRASVPGRPPVYGNFLAPGPHWEAVARFLDGDDDATDLAEPPEIPAGPLATSSRASQWRRIDKLPGNLDPARVDACIAASRRIRLERQLDYPCPVVLKSAGITLTLEPVSGGDANRHVPFRLRDGTRSVDGKFLLRRYGPDPLPLLIRADVTDDDAINAWIYALAGFADATCFELPAPPSVRNVSRRRSPIPVPQPRSAPEPRRLPRRSRWPRHLKPEGYWAREGNWLVAAHRRHLPEGWTAGADAVERARQAAIVLSPEETWVKAHFCGRAHLAEVCFRWEPTARVRL